MTCVLEYTPHDTWFFRESRAQNAVGAVELASVFPPPLKTLAGALRTHIGDASSEEGIDWRRYARDENHPMRDRIGSPADPAPLVFTGPFVCRAGEPLYQAPADLLQARDGSVVRLTLGDPARCDLGRVRLPALPNDVSDVKPLDNAWLTADGLAAYLAGVAPAPSHIVSATAVIAEEPRLGIAMSSAARAAQQGLLYQTRHLRAAESGGTISVRIGVEGLEARDIDTLPALVRLGGEGRMAGLATTHGSLMPDRPEPNTSGSGLVITTLTACSAGETPGMLPGFEQVPSKETGHDVWRGEIAGVALTLHGAACGKPLRLGGWQMASDRKNGPAAVRSLVPPGSVWYATADTLPNHEAIQKIHGQHVANDDPWHRGLVACGIWNDTTTKGEGR